MAKGSQLAQLKSALSDAGVSRTSQKKLGKKRKRSGTVPGAREKDKDKATKKLHEIHERLNPFDVKVTKLKHDVGGRKLKGVIGRPGLSKQAGIEQRKKTLLVEFRQKNHAGGVVDRRFGENDPSMPPEERMLERFTRERQRSSKGVAFNLEDTDELTHYGQTLSAMDDFDGVGLDVDDLEEDNGQIDGKTVGKSHFGGFGDDEESDDNQPAKKKSKAEVMAEVIAKSKEHKYQRQMEKEEDENVRYQLDQEFDSIRGLLMNDPGASTGSNSVPLGPRPVPVDRVQLVNEGDQEYDQFVRELAFDKRSKPKDRTKTEEEVALEEKEALEKAERARVRRMMGTEDESDDDDEDRKGRKRKRQRGGDDLDDDFLESDALPGDLGPGLGSDDEDEMAGIDGSGSNRDSDARNSTGYEGADSDEPEDNQDGEHLPLVSSLLRPNKRRHSSKGAGLPFTFSCPETHDDFQSIIVDVNDEDVPTVVQRIRSLHHPSLSQDNPAKLQAFTTVLIDYILHITSPPTPRFPLLELLLPHISALTRMYPAVAAQAFVSKIVLMEKNLMRGLSNGATSMESRTWPGPAELGLLRVIGVIWSTSDLNHAVISPTRVLMGAYLGLSRIRSCADLASGLFLCTIFLQYEEFSKRLVPEAVNFLLNAVLHLAPHSFNDLESIPGSFPIPDFGNDVPSSLKINGKNTNSLKISRPDLIPVLCGKDTPQIRVDLLDTTFQLLEKYADIYKGQDGFFELYHPVVDVLIGLSLDRLPTTLQKRRSTLQDMLKKLLKFSKQARRPLLLQAHKPIPIPSYVPKFSATSSNYLRKQDPDHERATAAKLRHQVKQERKGAIRELRKDSRFLAGVQQQRQMELDKGYNDRMKKAFSSIEGERAEQKALDREKAREKKRTSRR